MHNLWLPDLSDTRTAGDNRMCGACNKRIYFIHKHVRRVHFTAKEPRLERENGAVGHRDTVLSPVVFSALVISIRDQQGW
jgi:hypothetical protein